MASEGGLMDCTEQKFCVKRFAYDVLSVTLAACGFPESQLPIKDDEDNDYPHRNDVFTIFAGVIASALYSRDKWKTMFGLGHERFGLNDMQKIEEFLLTIQEGPEFRWAGLDVTNVEDLSSIGESPAFRLTPYLDKIRLSLALYSELILFLHSQNIEFDFEQLLDSWSNYFYEKIALKEDPDKLLLALFIEDSEVESYIRFVGAFIDEIAIPYGKNDNVSTEFQLFSEALHQFSAEPERFEENFQEYLNSRSKSPPRNLLATIPEDIEESVSYFTELLKSESVVLPGELESPEAPHDFPLPSSSRSGLEDRLEQMSIEDDPENVGKTPNVEMMQ